MKKVLMAVSVLFVSVALCSAQGFNVGGHVAFPMGGDVEEGQIGFGVQASLPLPIENFSMEAAWTRFGDEDSEEGMKLEATANVLAATLIYNIPLEAPVAPYVGAGISYMMMSADITLDLSAEDRAYLEDLAEAYGLTYAQLLEELGIAESQSMDLDNTIAFHFCGGATVQLTDNLKAFGEYRYTMGKVKGEGLDEDYNFGLAKVGIILSL